MRFRFYDVYMLMRMGQMVSRYSRSKKRMQKQRPQKERPLTDAQIEKAYLKAHNPLVRARQRHVRKYTWGKAGRVDGTPITVLFLVILALALLYTLAASIQPALH